MLKLDDLKIQSFVIDPEALRGGRRSETPETDGCSQPPICPDTTEGGGSGSYYYPSNVGCQC